LKKTEVKVQTLETKDVSKNSSLSIKEQNEIQFGYLSKQYTRLKQKQQDLEQQ
jgi:hypothetical protein